MNTTSKFFAFLVFIFVSCQKKETANNIVSIEIPDSKTEWLKINTLQKKYDEPSQIFTIDSNKPKQVKGNQGTIITIDPENLISVDGQPLGKTIEVELKELTNQEQLLRANAQTTSNGQLLISGGAYYINLTTEGKQLKLKDDKTLAVDFPKITAEEMFLFYGQRDTLGQLDWEQTNQKLKSKPQKKEVTNTTKETTYLLDDLLIYIENGSETDTLTTEEITKNHKNLTKTQELQHKMYQTVQLNKFGWINCDRFIQNQNSTNLYYTFNHNDTIVSANVYLVFKDRNSIINNFYFKQNDSQYVNGFFNIPLQSNTKLIAFSVKNDKIYSFQSDVVVTPNQTIQLNMVETSEEEMNKLFKLNE